VPACRRSCARSAFVAHRDGVVIRTAG
jgi:hypothetical protein